MKAKAAQRVKDMLTEALDPDRSLREMARIAFSDIRELFNAEGKLLPIKDWPEDIARAVAGVEVVRGNVDKADGQFDEILKVKLWDKGRPLENALKKHGHLTDKLEVKGDSEMLALLLEGRERAAKA